MTLDTAIQYILLFILVAMPIFLVFWGKTYKEILPVIIAICFALAFHNISSIATIRGGGLEIVTRAQDTINGLQKLAVSLSSAIVRANATPRAFGGGTPVADELRLAKQISDDLKNIGIPENEIEKVTSPAYRDVANDIIYMIFESLERSNPDKKSLIQEQYLKKTGDLYSEWDTDRLDKFIKQNTLKEDKETSNYIREFAHFLKDKTLRRSQFNVLEN